MKKLHSFTTSALLLLLVLISSGCMPAVHLNTPEVKKAPTRIGSVALGEITNLRPPSAGGEDFAMIGEVRRGAGRPATLRAEEGREVDIALREALRNALDYAGYYALTPAIPGEVPHLDVDVMRFWGESRAGYRIETVLVVKLVHPEERLVLAQRKINISRDFAVTGRVGSLPRAFDTIMGELQKELAAFMLSDPFRNAVRRK